MRDFLLRHMPQRAVCGEIGVFDGEFSLRILAITRPARLHLIDPWVMHAKSAAHEQAAGEQAPLVGGLQSNIQFQQVQSKLAAALAAGVARMHRAFSHEAAAQFADSYFDWIYIDASHEYEDVKRDLHDYLPKVRSGGLISGDDYGRRGRGVWNYGVSRAVDEFTANGKAQRILVRRHQYLLRKP